MSRKFFAILAFIILIFFIAHPGLTLSSEGIVNLKKAGISDKTIELIVKEKVIETAAFSVDDIVNMKKAGVSEKTLQLLIKDSSLPANAEPIIYGRETRSIRQISPQDIIRLKKNGISDSVIQSLIESAKSCDEKDRERAWRIFENMDLWIHATGGR